MNTPDDIDGLLDHIRNLVVLRGIFATRRATADELREYDTVIAAARARLAESTRVVATAA
jgi:hypothetical protein